MRKIALILLALLFAVPALGQGGIANFPQTLPPQTVVGRLGIAPGPTQAIPISQLAAVFGASRSVTVNAKCDGATDDTAAINADLALGGYWTLPPGKTCNVTQINITKNGTRLSGAGFNASIIQGTTAAVPTVNISATLSSVYLDGFQVTKSVTATSGGTGINFAGDCQYCVIDGIYVQKSWVGIAAQSTGIGYMRHVLAQFNLSDGITFTNSTVSGTLQWDLDDVFSGQNAGRGYRVFSTAAGAATGITLGSWHNVRTFANTGVGIAVACSVSIPCNGFRLTKGLLGQDGNHEVFLDSYGGLHTISASTIVELAGTSPTGPSLATAASNTGDGIRITANNLDVSIGDVYANGNHDSGINTSATVSTNVSGFRISNQGLNGILAANCALLTVTSVNFVNNGTHINCTTNSGSQQVATSTPASLNSLAALPVIATNTALVNATSGSATPSAFAMPSCSTAGSALKWTTNTGFGCNSAITAAAVPASGLTGATLAAGVVASSLSSLGTLSSLTVSGAVSLTNNAAGGQVFLGASSDTGQTYFQLNNSSAGGSNWQFANAGSVSALPVGSFYLWNSAGTYRQALFASGGVGFNTTTDPGNGNLSIPGAYFSKAPVTLTGTSGSVGVSDSSVIVNASGTFTLTLPAAATYSGRWINLKSIAAQTVNSASSNVVPLAGGAAGTALLTATAGKFARLQSDGANWQIMAAN